MTQTAILEGLSRSKLAVEMTEDQRKALAAVMTLRDLAQGEVVVREGDSDDHLYVVASGEHRRRRVRSGGRPAGAGA